MQYRGKPPQVAPSQLSAAGSGAGRQQGTVKTERQQLGDRFDELAAEVAERQEFLDSMREVGGLTAQHINIIKGQIAAKAVEMQHIDSKLKQLDL